MVAQLIGYGIGLVTHEDAGSIPSLGFAAGQQGFTNVFIIIIIIIIIIKSILRKLHTF